ncbi:hypothetical protein B0H16DRAFT_11783 [Mycena metata]|uniref:Uncharacterized protein n=1 Tax=Mycena metata TaxID=1033252 RepID=A0AAD7KHN0_9AGAR|nr:hypothetical protein B0H16DRAFT_11783 [Mycena metata]
MHHLRTPHYAEPDAPRYHPRYETSPPLGHIVASASSVLDQAPPPSLRDILGAYKANGDGDRDMLLAMLNAKAAEDQRLASLAALHRTMLEVYQSPPLSPVNGSHHHYPTPKFTHSPPLREARPPRVYHQVSSLSRSPPHTRVPLPYMRPQSPQPEHRRKRVRSSRSPPPRRGESVHDPHSELPPSPYSSSGSESASHSPRSRGSMTIGSLLSAGPNRDGSGEPTLPDRVQGSQQS